MKTSKRLLAAAVALSLAAVSLAPAFAGSDRAQVSARYSAPPATLVIHRAPNFGNHSSVVVYVDGRLVGTMNYGQDLATNLSAGDHVAVLVQQPHLNDSDRYSRHIIRLRPGQVNAFTAIWTDGGNRIGLNPS